MEKWPYNADTMLLFATRISALEAACLGLKDRMAALEVSCSEERPGHPEDAPARETGWVVVDHRGDIFTAILGFVPPAAARPNKIIWISSKEDAAKLRDLLVETMGPGSICGITLLYKDTLEEVDA